MESSHKGLMQKPGAHQRETKGELDLGESFFPFIILLIKHIVCCPLIGSQLDKRCSSTKRAHRGGSWSSALLPQERSLALL